VLAWYRDVYREALERSLAGRRLISGGAVGIGVFVYVVWIGVPLLASSPLAEPAPIALDELFPPLAVAWVVARALGAVITVPIIEELAFRGFLLRRLIDSDFTRVPYERWSWRAALISSIAFAALHQQWLGGLVAGLAYAYAQTRRGLLVDAIVAHAVTNLLIAVEVLVLGHWTLW
jgi:CAAX prenyl protease-like protein